jgi:hypothetical protein
MAALLDPILRIALRDGGATVPADKLLVQLKSVVIPSPHLAIKDHIVI